MTRFHLILIVSIAVVGTLAAAGINHAYYPNLPESATIECSDHQDLKVSRGLTSWYSGFVDLDGDILVATCVSRNSGEVFNGPRHYYAEESGKLLRETEYQLGYVTKTTYHSMPIWAGHPVRACGGAVEQECPIEQYCYDLVYDYDCEQR